MNFPHPNDQVLQAYGLGKLDDESAGSINAHLEDCPDCRQRISGFTSDSFLGRFREAHQPSGRSIPGASMVDGTLSFLGAKAASPPPPADTMPPGLANHPDYEIKRELGRGGMGVVYLAHNAMMGRDEVLKVMGRHIMERPGVLERFQREIRAVAKLRHPNIVAAYHAFRIEGGLVFSMEYVEGLDLARLVKAKGPLTVPQAAYFIHQAALGLQHAHEKGLIHRDIKPHNLMLTHDGKARLVKVLDFGLAKATREQTVDGGLTSEGQALGTPDYIAPEQIVNALDVDIRADLYSLGGTLFYLLTGRPPFQAVSLYDLYQAHMSRDAEPLNLLRPEVPAELAALVSKLMAKEPNRRFQAPGEVAEALVPFFRKVGAASRGTGPEISQAGPSMAGRAGANPASTPTRPGTHVGEPMLRTRNAEPEADGWPAGSIDGLSSDGAVILRPAEGKSRPPRRKLAIIAASSAASLALLLGIIIIVKWDRGGGSIVVIKPGDRATKGHAAPEASSTAPSPGHPEKPEKERSPDPAPVPPPAPFDLAKFDIYDKGTMWPQLAGPGAGEWYTEGNELVMKFGKWDTINPPRATLLFGDPSWTDYDYTCKVKQVALGPDGGGSFIMVFRSRARQSQYEFMANPGDRWPQTLTAFDLQHQQGEELGKGDDPGPRKNRIMLDEWYTLRAEVRGDRIRCFLSNGAEEVLVFDVKDARHSAGRVGIKTIWGTHRFKDIKVTASDGRVLWEGLPKVPPLAEVANHPPTPAPPKDPEFASDARKTPAAVDPAWKGDRFWKVAGGSIQGFGSIDRGRPHSYLYSDISYKDFELKCRVWLKGGVGNSGIQIRSELVDASRFLVRGPQIDIGGNYWGSLYGEDFPPRKGGMMQMAPANLFARVVKPFEFNDLAIRCVGKRLSVKINGSITIDDVFPQMPDEGRIAWQLHSGEPVDLMVEDLAITELTVEAQDDGYRPLFNGKDLVGWSAWAQKGPLSSSEAGAIWSVSNGILHGHGGPSHLFSPRGDYQDFRLRAEVKINDGGNSGIYFRTDKMAGFPAGYEAQINSTHHDPIKTGSLYGFANVQRIIVPPEVWFTMVVEALGNHIRIWIDGKLLVDYPDPNKRYNGKHFAIQAHDPKSYVQIRRLEVAELNAVAPGLVGRNTRKTPPPRDAGPAKVASLTVALKKTIPMKYPDGIPLHRFIDEIKRATKGPDESALPVYVDPIGLQDADKTMDVPIVVELENQPLERSLRKALNPLGLDYRNQDGMLLISSGEILREWKEREVVVPNDGRLASKQILAALEKAIPMRFPEGISLRALPIYIKRALMESGAAGFDIHLDPQGIEDADKNPDSKAIIDLEGIPLKVTLHLLLRELGMAYYIEQGLLTISTRECFPPQFKEPR